MKNSVTLKVGSNYVLGGIYILAILVPSAICGLILRQAEEESLVLMITSIVAVMVFHHYLIKAIKLHILGTVRIDISDEGLHYKNIKKPSFLNPTEGLIHWSEIKSYAFHSGRVLDCFELKLKNKPDIKTWYDSDASKEMLDFQVLFEEVVLHKNFTSKDISIKKPGSFYGSVIVLGIILILILYIVVRIIREYSGII